MSQSLTIEQLRQQVKALTFDLFGTVLDLGGSLTPPIGVFLKERGRADVDPKAVWREWRYRQRIEQYQDNILAMGHSGYLPVARRALVYVLGLFDVKASKAEVDGLMGAWQNLSPFPEVSEGLKRLASKYKLVALSNGEQVFIDHLARSRIKHPFDAVISVQDVGAFKPHPGVYRHGAAVMGLEVGQCLMVSANSFDVMGARTCGMRGAFVNREGLPYEDTEYRPDVEVRDFLELADALGC